MPFWHDQFAALDAAEQQLFCSFFANELTIVGRAVWSDDTLNPDQQVLLLKWLNEIQHRLHNLMSTLLIGRFDFDHSDTWNVIDTHASEAPGLEAELLSAASRAYNRLERVRAS